MLKVVALLFFTAVAFCLFCLVGTIVVKAESLRIEIDNLEMGDLVAEGFELNEKSDIDIFAVGAGRKYNKFLSAYGWIIDADNREPVWSMLDDCYEINRLTSSLVECEETVTLPPGKYEVYYYVGTSGIFSAGNLNIEINDLGDLVDFFGGVLSLDDEKQENLTEEELEDLLMIVKSDGPARRFDPDWKIPRETIVSIREPRKDEYHHRGFSLDRETELEIYAIGEFADSYDLFVDGAWIIDADTREKVWTMDKWNTERAGGAFKNRFFRDIIPLPVGNYIAYYATDDSHDAGEWNAPPPADPHNYGLLIAVADPGHIDYVSDFDEQMYETEIVSLTRIRDNAYEKKGFRLNKDSRIHILAIGERDYRQDRLADYGWIVNAEDFGRVWEMTSDNTDHAGGAAKNCRFDGVIELKAGDYIVYYRSDDSHAYNEWNAPAPFESDRYGITVSGMGAEFSEGDFALIDETEALGDAIADLTRLGDDADVRHRFKLDQTTHIRVMALGEGKGDKMYDYGWIKNLATDQIVWEMTYRKTHHGGGAGKNRAVVADITLEAGQYEAVFVTDDSHSFMGFNAAPPDNPEQWGMIITKR